jgi:DNA-binding PadR family transcriptional regulator
VTPIQAAILRAIATASEPPTPVAIREGCGQAMAERTVHKMLARMSERGLVQRLPALRGAHNGPPRPRYRLTSKGMEVLAGIPG